jgi:hypothetical protein
MNMIDIDRKKLQEFLDVNIDFLRSNNIYENNNLYIFKTKFLYFVRTNHLEDNLYFKKIELMIESEIYFFKYSSRAKQWAMQRNIGDHNIIEEINREASIIFELNSSNEQALNKSIESKIEQNEREGSASRLPKHNSSLRKKGYYNF